MPCRRGLPSVHRALHKAVSLAWSIFLMANGVSYGISLWAHLRSGVLAMSLSLPEALSFRAMLSVPSALTMGFYIAHISFCHSSISTRTRCVEGQRAINSFSFQEDQE